MNGPLKMDLNPLLVTCTFGKCLDPMGIALVFHYVFHQETDDASKVYRDRYVKFIDRVAADFFG